MTIGEFSLTDSNGNSISGPENWVDTLGVTVLTPSANGYNWTDANGYAVGVSLTNTSYTDIRTAYGCSGFSDYDQPGSLPTAIVFPDTTTLALAYEATPGYSSDRTGRISQITMRDGVSTIQYNYNPNNATHDGLNCSYFVPNEMTRTTADGTTTYTWTSTGSGSNTTTVIDAGGNKIVYTFVDTILTQKQTYTNTGTISSPVYSLLTTDVYC